MLNFNNFIINTTRFHQRIIESIINDFPIELITEGLIKSIDYDIVENLLKKLFIKYNKKVIILVDHQGIYITVKNKVFNKYLMEGFFNLLKVVGYNISYYYIDNKQFIDKPLTVLEIFSEYNELNINLIKKYDTEEKGIPNYLYHITNKKYLDKIKKNGLIPKSKNKIEKYPDRIYITNNIVGAKNIKKDYENKYKNDEWIILKINTKLLNKIKLYLDPTYFMNLEDYNNYEYKVCYTYDNIPNESIELI